MAICEIIRTLLAILGSSVLLALTVSLLHSSRCDSGCTFSPTRVRNLQVPDGMLHSEVPVGSSLDFSFDVDSDVGFVFGVSSIVGD